MINNKLRTLDLFSGIGGLSFALKEETQTIAYCEICPDATNVLKAAMKKGFIDEAPVFPDIKLLQEEDLKSLGRIDLVMGGFPCVGFCALGGRMGLLEAESALFYEMIRIVETTKPSLAFMENVPNVIKMGLHDIYTQFGQMGYEIRWLTLAASDLGALHDRRRWFCLAVSANAREQLVSWKPPTERDVYDWASTSPARMVKDRTSENLKRCRLLGNGVVPDCVHWAFQRLSGLGLQHLPNQVTRLKGPKAWGYAAGTGYFELPKPKFQKRKNLSLMLDPGSYRTIKPLNRLVSSPLITTVIQKQRWATPRRGVQGAYLRMTKRSLADLPTQIRFERETPDDLREGQQNAEFLEFLMGYPLGYTET